MSQKRDMGHPPSYFGAVEPQIDPGDARGITLDVDCGGENGRPLDG